MMAQKAAMFGYSDILRKIMASDNPAIMNQFGRQVRNFNPDVWDAHCQYIVKKANIAKFSQNHFLNKILPFTGDRILVEASPYDTIWGILRRRIHRKRVYRNYGEASIASVSS